MARIRTIKPEFWTNPQVTRVPFAARLLFIGTWNFADDHGNLPRDSEKLKLQVFPGDVIDVEPLLLSLIDQGLLTEYSVRTQGTFAQRFLHIPTFTKHQLVNRPSKPLYPLPDMALAEDSLSPHGRKGKGRESSKPKTIGSSGVSGKPSRARKSTKVPTPPAPSAAHTPSPSAALTLVMRQAGIAAQPANPRIVAAAELGITPEVMADACAEAHATHPGERIAANYVLSIVERWQREGTAPVHATRASGRENGNARHESQHDARKRTAEAFGVAPRTNGDVFDLPPENVHVIDPKH
ncbi:hypothetical protein P0D88_31375 [Paraburkholderia sp. RL18-103-BIB-C]|uniref:hypothetical protein n=1 Tax=Paraburkholderia sp. RL18-103-BIB-C TaxID=3031637 RepID=UPI0038BD4C7E